MRTLAQTDGRNESAGSWRVTLHDFDWRLAEPDDCVEREKLGHATLSLPTRMIACQVTLAGTKSI